jgi:hypothetical protein
MSVYHLHTRRKSVTARTNQEGYFFKHLYINICTLFICTHMFIRTVCTVNPRSDVQSDVQYVYVYIYLSRSELLLSYE